MENKDYRRQDLRARGVAFSAIAREERRVLPECRCAAFRNPSPQAGRSFELVEFATLEWTWFNHRRLIEPIGNIPPAKVEEQNCAMLDQPAIVA